jgi:hypothetical protein
MVEEEVESMLPTFTKANKNFSCCAIAGLIRMLQDSGCEHLPELHSLAASSDASLLVDILSEVMKITSQLVQMWWSQHDLPEALRHLQKEPEVAVFTLKLMFLDSVF